ncbi:MAG: methyl-accepting chemotaxis protein [Hormoscilla sp.]
MERLRSWKLRYWIAAGYAVPILLAFLSAILVFWNVGVARKEDDKLRNSMRILERIEKLAIEVKNLSLTTRAYLLAGDEISSKSYEVAIQNYEKILSELNRLVAEDIQKDLLREVDELVKGINRTDKELIALVNRGKAEEAIEQWKAENVRQRSDRINNLLSDLLEAERSLVEKSEQLQRQALEQLVMVVVGAAILSMLVALSAGYWIISAIIQRINSSASAVANSATEISATIEQQERTASGQAASVNQTTATMDELAASSQQSAEQAEMSASEARQVLNLSEQGTKAVDRSLQEMSHLKDKVGAIASQIQRLSEQTNQISNISGLVSDLANQTNMLALNAAVEAVRAGEYGRGFAVVAAEIRKLADESKKSAEKINVLVNDVQGVISTTIIVTDDGTKTVEIGVNIARETAEAFVGMTDAINNVVISSQQISLNAKQQAIAISQVMEAMNSLNEAAQETASGISQVKKGTQQLKASASEMKSVI